MPRQADIVFLRRKLLLWFGVNQRQFPWRNPDVSNYELIFSEILLQRTRAETVAKNFGLFFGEFPDWESICEASLNRLEEVLKPFGLYRRRAMRIFNIAREYEKKQGRLPRSKTELQESNMGALYISNAFELFVLKRRAALLDVNMARVLGRFLFCKEPNEIRLNKALQLLAKRVINVKHCKELNWAFLDFAAIQCKKNNPKCFLCPLSKKCQYFLFYKTIASSKHKLRKKQLSQSVIARSKKKGLMQ